jgi:hypothetical protein
MIIMLVISRIIKNICVGPHVSAMIVAKSRDSRDMERHGTHIGIAGMDGTETADLCVGSVCLRIRFMSLSARSRERLSSTRHIAR